MSEVKNLWGNINVPSASVPGYVNLMQEQADLLESQTQGLLLGELFQSNKYGVSSYRFDIVAPKLNDYRYTLFLVVAGFYSYPVFLYDRGQYDGPTWENVEMPYDRQMKKDTKRVPLNVNPTQRKLLLPPTYYIEEDSQFESSLAKILQSNSTKEVIRILLEKSQSVFT